MALKRFVPYVLSTSIIFGQLAAFAQTTGLNAQIQNTLSQKTLLKAGSNVFETQDLIKFYQSRNFEPVWIVNGQPTAYVEAFRQLVQKLSLKHGLIESDYWNSEVDAYLKGLNESNALATEVLLTQLLVKLGSHLSDGRIEPTTLDNDIRFKKRTFKDHAVLAQAVSGQPSAMSDIVESLAPKHIYYKNTLEILAQLNSVKQQGGFKTVKNPKVTIKLNSKHPVVPALRQRVIQHGYVLTGQGDTYDAELSAAIQEIQKENGFLVNADLLPDSGAWNVLTASLDSRLQQTLATLEKLRWLPKTLEPNMIFVNTNATELKIYENNQVIKEMKTINGRAIRRTPMMQTWLTQVILNPKWTATDSVIIQDKLPEIIKDVNYLKKIRMRIISKATGQEVDPATLDWKRDARTIAKRHDFVMDPGPKNALGVYKFPMSSEYGSYGSNPDAIFMHFTDDPSLFEKTSRHLSSGCIRLSEAKWFAEYLLKNNSQYTPAYIDSVISKGTVDEVFQTDIYVRLPQNEFRAVYTVPLTVEKTASGRARFMKDVYLQDRRILNQVLSNEIRTDKFQSTVVASTVGTLLVSGELGSSQYSGQVLAAKCEEPQAVVNAKTSMRQLVRRCQTPVKLGLNEAKNIEAGSYIVGFENSIYPGFVEIKTGETTQIQLQKIVIPSQFAKESAVKVYRDFGSLIEQKKVYFEEFYAGKNLFRQTIRSYGDLSVAGMGEADAVASASYSYCSEMNMNTVAPVRDIREHALFVCESINAAQSMMDLADMYRFNSNGTYQEAVVDYPGDIFPKRYLRTLVSAPIKAGDFVSVMPGVYRISGDSGKNEARANVMKVAENYPNAQRVFAKSRLSSVNNTEISEADVADKVDGASTDVGVSTGGASKCATASVWRTEQRSYCTQESQEGCAKSSTLCEEIKLDLRFRK